MGKERILADAILNGGYRFWHILHGDSQTEKIKQRLLTLRTMSNRESFKILIDLSVVIQP